jgi:hypothetical protein
MRFSRLCWDAAHSFLDTLVITIWHWNRRGVKRFMHKPENVMRARNMEHLLHIMKQQFCFTKYRFRGFENNVHNNALTNLVLSMQQVMPIVQPQLSVNS